MNAKTKMMAIFATGLVILSSCGQKANNATTENNVSGPEQALFEADLSGDKLVIGEIYKP